MNDAEQNRRYPTPEEVRKALEVLKLAKKVGPLLRLLQKDTRDLDAKLDEHYAKQAQSASICCVCHGTGNAHCTGCKELCESVANIPPAPLVGVTEKNLGKLVDGELRDTIYKMLPVCENFEDCSIGKPCDNCYDSTVKLAAHLQAAVRETKLGVINDYFEVALCEMGRFCSKHSTHDPAQFLENCQQQLNQGEK